MNHDYPAQYLIVVIAHLAWRAPCGRLKKTCWVSFVLESSAGFHTLQNSARVTSVQVLFFHPLFQVVQPSKVVPPRHKLLHHKPNQSNQLSYLWGTNLCGSWLVLPLVKNLSYRGVISVDHLRSTSTSSQSLLQSNHIWLVVSTPLKNMTSSMGRMTTHIWNGK